MTHVMETGTVPTWHSHGMGSLHSHLTTCAGSSSPGIAEATALGIQTLDHICFTRLYHTWTACRTASYVSCQHTCMQKTRALHVDRHTNSPSIDRFVVADGRAWRAASPTRLRSDLHWRCASLRLTALRCYSPSSLLERDFTRAELVGGHASKRAKHGKMGCH